MFVTVDLDGIYARTTESKRDDWDDGDLAEWRIKWGMGKARRTAGVMKAQDIARMGAGGFTSDYL